MLVRIIFFNIHLIPWFTVFIGLDITGSPAEPHLKRKLLTYIITQQRALVSYQLLVDHRSRSAALLHGYRIVVALEIAEITVLGWKVQFLSWMPADVWCLGQMVAAGAIKSYLIWLGVSQLYSALEEEFLFCPALTGDVSFPSETVFSCVWAFFSLV